MNCENDLSENRELQNMQVSLTKKTIRAQPFGKKFYPKSHSEKLSKWSYDKNFRCGRSKQNGTPTGQGNQIRTLGLKAKFSVLVHSGKKESKDRFLILHLGAKCGHQEWSRPPGVCFVP
jgi:hypothetical protein